MEDSVEGTAVVMRSLVGGYADTGVAGCVRWWFVGRPVVGRTVGLVVGRTVGRPVVGRTVGLVVGRTVGLVVGRTVVGCVVGLVVGLEVVVDEYVVAGVVTDEVVTDEVIVTGVVTDEVVVDEVVVTGVVTDKVVVDEVVVTGVVVDEVVVGRGTVVISIQLPKMYIHPGLDVGGEVVGGRVVGRVRVKQYPNRHTWDGGGELVVELSSPTSFPSLSSKTLLNLWLVSIWERKEGIKNAKTNAFAV